VAILMISPYGLVWMRARRVWLLSYPVATAAAVTATATVTAVVIGSVVNSLPPSCSEVVVNQVTYLQCGSIAQFAVRT
jgi:hypothetical protein